MDQHSVQCSTWRCRRWRRCRRRKGQSLIEFSLVAFALYFVVAGILTFGQLFYGAQTLQSAADTAAREIARIPLPPSTSPFPSGYSAQNGISLYDVLYNPGYSTAPAGSPYANVRTQLFDQQYLMVNLNSLPSGMQLADWVKTWPIINQMLYPLMIVNYVNTSSNDQNQVEYLWYPGAVPGTDRNGWPAYRIALVTGRNNSNGAETIEWVPVIEEIYQDDPVTTGDSYFGFNVQSQQGGLVSLRINYPYQSATMSAYAQQTTWPPQPNGEALAANDSQVVVTNPGDFTPASGALTNSVYPTYDGPYGLGNQQAWSPVRSEVRPFRRLLSAQAVARREVFDNPTN